MGAAQRAAAERREQGLPEHVADPELLHAVAGLVTSSNGNGGGRSLPRQVGSPTDTITSDTTTAGHHSGLVATPREARGGGRGG